MVSSASVACATGAGCWPPRGMRSKKSRLTRRDRERALAPRRRVYYCGGACDPGSKLPKKREKIHVFQRRDFLKKPHAGHADTPVTRSTPHARRERHDSSDPHTHAPPHPLHHAAVTAPQTSSVRSGVGRAALPLASSFSPTLPAACQRCAERPAPRRSGFIAPTPVCTQHG